ncbi:Dynein light chain 2, cytoplasmic [Echinococcus granulosus]|uniref:Dynein light chain 2, cytoplasmic n=1 Tax=Echinococcus granulosus TaxID=6210 RepID=W6VC84_ECHGR|nr:Dynein light chain 2, cytoplasmic [Echinococcus granulosus]EUB64454.1 Dynein light chain 2, cytoplasmic [Echinococcus granulosus]
MSEEVQREAVDCGSEVMLDQVIKKDISEAIKRRFDSKYEPTWHRIVGRNFGRVEESIYRRTSFMVYREDVKNDENNTSLCVRAPRLINQLCCIFEVYVICLQLTAAAQINSLHFKKYYPISHTRAFQLAVMCFLRFLFFDTEAWLLHIPPSTVYALLSLQGLAFRLHNLWIRHKKMFRFAIKMFEVVI